MITTYSYDTLNRVSQVSHNTVSGVTAAPAVTYVYDTDPTYGTANDGEVVRINVGTDYQERYTFDQYKRTSSTIRRMGSQTYTTTDLRGRKMGIRSRQRVRETKLHVLTTLIETAKTERPT